MFNPLNETYTCDVRVVNKQQNWLIKMYQPNTWLYSIPSTIVLHLNCQDKIISTRINGTGILNLKEPCEIKIGEKRLIYEGEAHAPFKYTQPNFFSWSNETLKMPQPSKITTPHKDEVNLMSDDDAEELIRKATTDLGEIGKELTEADKHSPWSHTQTTTATSISIASMLGILLIVYAFKSLWRRCSTQKVTRIARSETINGPGDRLTITVDQAVEKPHYPQPRRPVEKPPQPPVKLNFRSKSLQAL